MSRSLFALCALNFFMADVRDGLGPFLGVFLQQQQWSPSAIGLVMTIGGLAGMLATTPAGALIDKTKAKRAVMIAAALAIIAASFVILFVPNLSPRPRRKPSTASLARSLRRPSPASPSALSISRDLPGSLAGMKPSTTPEI
jgi:MFS family permease